MAFETLKGHVVYPNSQLGTLPNNVNKGMFILGHDIIQTLVKKGIQRKSILFSMILVQSVQEDHGRLALRKRSINTGPVGNGTHTMVSRKTLRSLIRDEPSYICDQPYQRARHCKATSYLIYDKRSFDGASLQLGAAFVNSSQCAKLAAFAVIVHAVRIPHANLRVISFDLCLMNIAFCLI